MTSSYINENQLCKLVDSNSVVTIKDDCLYFTDRRMAIKADYTLHKLMQKLYSQGLITGYKNIESKTRCFNISDLFITENQFDAEKTDFLMQSDTFTNKLLCCFKYNNEFAFYKEEYIKVFEHCTYKVTIWERQPMLKVFDVMGEIIGIVLPVMIRDVTKKEYIDTTIQRLEKITKGV